MNDIADNVPHMIWSLKTLNNENIVMLYRNTSCLQYNTNFSILDPEIVHPDDLRYTLLTWKLSVQNNLPFIIKHRLRNNTSSFQYEWFQTRAESKNDNVWYGTCTNITDFITDSQKYTVSKRTQTIADNTIQAGKIRAQNLAEKADVAETTRIHLSEYAKILAEEAKVGEQSRINLSEEIVKRTIAEQQLRIILNTLPIIIWVVNMEGVFTMAEGKGLNDLGMTSNTLINTSSYTFFPQSEHEFIKNSFKTTILTERQVQLGSKLYNIFYCPLVFDVGIIGVVILAQDISAQKQLEEQKSALILREQIAKNEVDVKSKFVANISHEMRTPLYGIMANIEFLLESKLNKTQIESANMAHQSVIYISKVINDILDITMLEQKEITLDNYIFPLYDTLKNTILLLQPSAIIKGLDYKIHIDSDIPPMVSGDPHRLVQILTNIVNNAIKFTDNGSIQINVISEEKSLHKMAAIRINIIDTGIGMSDNARTNIFKKFYQADSSTTRPYGGIGMGLNISQKLAHLMHGHISIKSNISIGSTFSIKLKFDRAPQQLAKHVIDEKNILLNKKILVNEDNIINQKIILKILRNSGAIVICVDNALIGLERWIEKKDYFDLILMDCHMPVMDGYEGTKLLRKSGCKIPIIALTANALQENLDKCISVGMNDYITKPAKPRDLVTKIKEWINTV